MFWKTAEIIVVNIYILIKYFVPYKKYPVWINSSPLLFNGYLDKF